ncbi:aldo/keto reductase [Novosphingobium sp. AP12]|uniref:aldo/keto reductase n=1 Tax=Novosphingobium sp. AP12 TaxID=1144305 RepID=UPI000271F68F|nr:aldo/keto reductase [Novosphingobium sp. AP12]EJL24278.1 putative oxidoreductase, aryl-alcohol dehydrogenase like protein [Novosphingobium sp. AP12]
MDYRLLGRSGLKISALTLGTMTFGGQGMFAKVGSTGLDDARRQVDMCLDAGVNFLDTADIYSSGQSEEILGQVIAGRRDRLLLGTKVRFPMGDSVNDRGLSRYHVIRACEASLKRLGTDCIDVYWLHQWDGLTPLDETLRALDDLTRAGKIGYVGVSNFSGWHVMKALAIAEREGLVRPVGQQIHYSLQARDSEYELLPIGIDQGLGAVIWSPLASGLLSGKYRRGIPEPGGTRRAADWNEPPVRNWEKLYNIVEVLVEIAALRNVTSAQVALAWLLGRPGISSVIVGARTEAQLTDNLKAIELRLTDEEFGQLEAVSQPPLLYPYWHQLANAKDRLSNADLLLMGPHTGG